MSESDAQSQPSQSQRSSRRRGGFDPVTSSPGRDLPAFEDESHLLGGDGREDMDEEEADGEELFGDNMEADYRPMPGLDRYDPDMLDDDPDNEGLMSESDRAAAEAAMRQRDRAEGRRVRGMRKGLLYDDDSDEDDGRPAARRRRLAERAAEGEDVADEDAQMVESIENLEDTRGRPVREYVLQVGPRTECANRFKNFLRTYVDANGHNLYREKIRHMCEGRL